MTHILFEHTDDGITIARAEAPTAWASLALVAGALSKTAHAYAYGQCAATDDYCYWAVLAPGEVAAMARPEEYFLNDDACTAERAARRGVSAQELHCPFAFVAMPGVPGAEAPTLTALSVLALQAADKLRGAVPAHTMPVACDTLSTDDADDLPCAGLLAARLDRPDALELATGHALCAVAGALIDDHPGITDWIPRHRDPTVRLRIPAGAPGIPLMFVPFVIETEAARRALDDRDLVDRALAQCASHALSLLPAQTH